MFVHHISDPLVSALQLLACQKPNVVHFLRIVCQRSLSDCPTKLTVPRVCFDDPEASRMINQDNTVTMSINQDQTMSFSLYAGTKKQ